LHKYNTNYAKYKWLSELEINFIFCLEIRFK